MKNKMMKLLSELLKDSKRSDRELAKVLKVSQPTVSRMRNKLVKDGFIHEFTVIPDLAKTGFELMAISFVKKKITEESVKKSEKWMMRYPNIIFAAVAEGMGKNGVMISVHENYADYSNFVRENLQYWGDELEDYGSMLVSLRGIVVKSLSLRYLAELVERSEIQL